MLTYIHVQLMACHCTYMYMLYSSTDPYGDRQLIVANAGATEALLRRLRAWSALMRK